MKELRMLGIPLDEGYVKRATEAEMLCREQKRQQQEAKAEREFLARRAGQHDDFFFIAGYPSGGAPYGVPWAEMGLAPWEARK